MTYQSGWLAADTTAASYGPNSQIGLIWNRPAISAITPKTIMKKPPALIAYRGNIRTPTTLSLVRPGPGHWVCFCLTRQAHVDGDQGEQERRDQQHVDDVQPRAMISAGELAAEERRASARCRSPGWTA